MTYEEIYAKVRSGEMLLSEFITVYEEWVEEAVYAAYNEGYRDGLENK